ncbi:MAG: DUF4956 domain-containing protein, partial [Clostridia bacterium]|nr:DUF4956 domain-containing protein [Clostridia bacterium]
DSHAQDSLISPLHTSLFNLLVLDAPYTERYVRCGERTGANHPLLLDCVTIMMVNGNIGAGVATAGAFSLVRFRSAPGTAREIALIFMTMVAGLVAGMGYLAYAVLFTLIMCVIFLILGRFDPEARGLTKTLRVTIPEDLDYDGVFDALMAEYCRQWKLTQVKTVNMGSLFRLNYQLTLKQGANEKAFIDALRCHNGNLEIALLQGENVSSEL